MNAFKEGYAFFERNAGVYKASSMGSEYVERVSHEIDVLRRDLNSNFSGFETDVNVLKGDIAEFWHADTFNIDAVVKDSEHRAFVERSHGLGSADINTNFGKKYQAKYYKDGPHSAKAQAISFFERFKRYQSKNPDTTFEEYLKQNGISYGEIEKIVNDPLYKDQMRLIPEEQLDSAKEWLKEQIEKEKNRRPEQAKRYQDTLNKLTGRVEDGKGVSSQALSNKEAVSLARMAKDGKIDRATLKKLGISTEDLIKYDNVIHEAVKAGTTSATITFVLKVVPEIYKAVSFLIKNGYIDIDGVKNTGFAVISGTAASFINGCTAAAITTSCKAGLLGEAFKSVDPTIVGVAVVLAMNTLHNSFLAATGKMEAREVANELIKDMFVATCGLIGGGISQGIINIPTLGYLIGNFIGSTIGALVYSTGYSVVMSFCIESGITLFGLVEQNYELPDDVLEAIGADVFKYEEVLPEEIHPEELQPELFRYEQFQPETISIDLLRRGVIGVHRIGYV